MLLALNVYFLSYINALYLKIFHISRVYIDNTLRVEFYKS